MDYSSSHDQYHCSSWPDTLLSIDRRKAVDELLRGRQLANRLRSLLAGLESAGPDHQSDDLVVQILESFAATLAMLSSSDSDEVVSKIPAVPTSEDSGGDSCKSSSTLKERRGCYKKRKTDDTHTRVTPDLIDDGYAWRKYGQKDILHAEFPRNYFRCTHKYDQPGCQATKQVQQISKNPPMFRTTYQNNHTCKNFQKPPQIIFDQSPPMDSSKMLCFSAGAATAAATYKQETDSNNHFFSSCFAAAPPVKHESKEEIMAHNNNQSSSSDQYMESLPDFAELLPSDQHNGDVISGVNSCTTSSHSCFDFEDVCNFNFDYYN